MSDDMNERVKRVHRLFMRGLERDYPNHPWVLRERNMIWQEPRPVDRWIWMDIEVWKQGELQRYGRVSWLPTGGVYDISMTYESEHGLGLYLWPAFHALSDAQEYVEKLMHMSSSEARALHGPQWIGVVL